MNKLQNVLNSLSLFKLRVYADDISRDGLISFISEVCGVRDIAQGQKRIVFAYDDDANKTVYKIAYSTQGIDDNIYEVLCGNWLMGLRQNGKITDDQFKRFGIATLYNNDPFIVKMPFIVPLNKDAEFNNWYESYGRSKYAGLEKNSTILLWLSTQSQLREDYNTIQAVLSAFFVPSDASMNEPLNFGIKMENGKRRLVLLDLGSIVPIVASSNGRSSLPICSCGHPMKYLARGINGPIGIDSLADFAGRYGCKNHSCQNNMSLVDELPSMDVKDSVVFTEYVHTHRAIINVYKALYGKYFTPNQRVFNINEYKNALRQSIGNNIPKDNVIKSMYKNFLFKMSGALISRTPELEEVRACARTDRGFQIRPYSSFKDECYDILEDLGEDLDNISDKCVANLYLIDICRGVGKYSFYEVISNIVYRDEFLRALPPGISEGDGMELFDDINKL